MLGESGIEIGEIPKDPLLEAVETVLRVEEQWRHNFYNAPLKDIADYHQSLDRLKEHIGEGGALEGSHDSEPPAWAQLAITSGLFERFVEK